MKDEFTIDRFLAHLYQIYKKEPKARIKVACDEEWNTIFNGIRIEKNSETGDYVIFGLSGTEEL